MNGELLEECGSEAGHPEGRPALATRFLTLPACGPSPSTILNLLLAFFGGAEAVA